jgi:hypothetical protein
MRETIPHENECKREGATMETVLPLVIAYAARKKHSRVPFRNYEGLREEWEEYPEGWEEQVLPMLAITAVLGSRKRAAAFVRSEKAELTEAEFKLARRWRSHPWWFCAFRVVEVRERSMAVIEAIGKAPSSWNGEQPPARMVLYSPKVASQYRSGKQLFIALLWEGELTYYTFGVMLCFSTGINEDDLFYFTDVARTALHSPLHYPLKGLNDRSTGFSDQMMDAPLAFLRLIKITETPLIETRKGRYQKTASACTVSDIDSLRDEERWREACASAGETLHRIIFDEEAAAIYLGEGSPMYDPCLYLSFPDSRVFLEAMTEEGYARGRAAALPLCEFPATAELRASMAIYRSALDIFEYEDELIMLKDIFEDRVDEEELPEEAGEESISSKEDFDAISSRIIGNYNEGIEEDDAKIARQLGVDEEDVALIRKKLDPIFERMGEEEGRAADRYGLSPPAFAQLSSIGVPDVEGVFRLRTAQEIRKEAGRRGVRLEELLARAPAYAFTDWLLRKGLSSGKVPATGAGYVATKVVKEAYAQRIIPTPEERVRSFHDFSEYMSEEAVENVGPKKESDWKEFHRLRGLTEDAGLLHYDGRNFQLGEDAESLLTEPIELYLHLFRVMCTTREWDYSENFGTSPFLRKMAGFLFYALGNLAKDEGWFSGDLLTERFIAAVPPIAEKVEEEKGHEAELFSAAVFAEIAVQIPFLTFFAESFGLAEIERTGASLSEFRVRPTALYELVFEMG